MGLPTRDHAGALGLHRRFSYRRRGVESHLALGSAAAAYIFVVAGIGCGLFDRAPNLVRRQGQDRKFAEYAYMKLVTTSTSPWRKYPWNLDLGNEPPVPPSHDKS